MLSGLYSEGFPGAVAASGTLEPSRSRTIGAFPKESASTMDRLTRGDRWSVWSWLPGQCCLAFRILYHATRRSLPIPRSSTPLPQDMRRWIQRRGAGKSSPGLLLVRHPPPSTPSNAMHMLLPSRVYFGYFAKPPTLLASLTRAFSHPLPMPTSSSLANG